jgi:hypothetical protein
MVNLGSLFERNKKYFKVFYVQNMNGISIKPYRASFRQASRFTLYSVIDLHFLSRRGFRLDLHSGIYLKSETTTSAFCSTAFATTKRSSLAMQSFN